MTLDELKALQNKKLRTLLIVAILCYLLLMLGLFLPAYLQVANEDLIKISVTLICGISILVALGWIGKRYVCQCPFCLKPIEGSLINIAVATGKCGHCGKVILDEETGELIRTTD